MAYQTPAQQLLKGSRPHSNHLDSTSFIRMTRVHSLPHSRHHSPPTTPDSIFSSLALSMLTYSHRVSPSSSFFQISTQPRESFGWSWEREREGKEIGRSLRMVMAQLFSPVCSETPLCFQASSSPSCCPRTWWRSSPGTTRSGIDFHGRCRSRRRMGFRIAASVAGDSLSKQDFADDYYAVLGLVILDFFSIDLRIYCYWFYWCFLSPWTSCNLEDFVGRAMGMISWFLLVLAVFVQGVVL